MCLSCLQLDFSTTWHHLRNVFKTAGPVRHVEIFKHSSGKSKGCGIVIYYDPESALRAISEFKAIYLLGNITDCTCTSHLVSSSVHVRDPFSCVRVSISAKLHNCL